MRQFLFLIMICGLLSGRAFADSDSDGKVINCGDHIVSHYHGTYTHKDGKTTHVCVEILSCTLFHMTKQQLSDDTSADVANGVPTEIDKAAICNVREDGKCPGAASCKEDPLDIDKDKIVREEKKSKHRDWSDDSSSSSTQGAH